MSTIVMVPGWGMRPAVYDGLAAVLASRFTVIALPLPGCDGTPPSAPYELDLVAADVAARAPRTCAVVGWSLGAQIALAWARTRPEQIERLALVSATPCFVQRDDWSSAMPSPVFDAFAAAVRDDRQAALRRFATLQAQGDARAREVARSLSAALDTRAAPAAVEGGLRILRESDLRDALSGIPARTLIVNGERDTLVPPQAAEWLAGALPRATLKLVTGVAHAPFVADPEAVGAAILEFIDGRSG